MDFSNRRRPFSFPMKGVYEKEYRPRKNEDDILIIQNSTLNTSSSRRYQSTQSSYIEHSEWDNASGTTFTQACSKYLEIDIATSSKNGALNDTPLYLKDEGEFKSSSDEIPTMTNDEEQLVTNQELNDFLTRFKPYAANHIPTVQERLELVQKIKESSLEYLLRVIFGDDGKYVKGANHIDRTTTPGEASADELLTQQALALGQNLGSGGSHYSFYYCAERETTCFDTTGTAITADGRKLSFNISLEMSRSFTKMAEEKCDFGEPRLCDPLVINLNTNVASVSDQKFFFDIDADGTEDEISMLGADSGYLALDHNEDGVINDGSELFGTASGNGFKDLMVHDEDGNGWIDEADSIFQKLKIWSMDENGNSTLIDLLEAGVGAIYLGYEDTEFSLKDAENKTNAVIQKTGLFLFEDGNAGTIQQMDLAV